MNVNRSIDTQCKSVEKKKFSALHDRQDMLTLSSGRRLKMVNSQSGFQVKKRQHEENNVYRSRDELETYEHISSLDNLDTSPKALQAIENDYHSFQMLPKIKRVTGKQINNKVSSLEREYRQKKVNIISGEAAMGTETTNRNS